MWICSTAKKAFGSTSRLYILSHSIQPAYNNTIGIIQQKFVSHSSGCRGVHSSGSSPFARCAVASSTFWSADSSVSCAILWWEGQGSPPGLLYQGTSSIL